MEAACPLLRFVNYDEPKTKREIYKSHFKAKIKRFSSDKVIFNEKRPIFVNFRSFFVAQLKLKADRCVVEFQRVEMSPAGEIHLKI